MCLCSTPREAQLCHVARGTGQLDDGAGHHLLDDQIDVLRVLRGGKDEVEDFAEGGGINTEKEFDAMDKDGSEEFANPMNDGVDENETDM